MGEEMARRGRHLVPIELTHEEREALERWVRRRKTAQQLATRSRVILLSAQGHSNREVARKAGLHETTVCVHGLAPYALIVLRQPKKTTFRNVDRDQVRGRVLDHGNEEHDADLEHAHALHSQERRVPTYD